VTEAKSTAATSGVRHSDELFCSGQYTSNDDCPEDKREDPQKCFMLYPIRRHIPTRIPTDPYPTRGYNSDTGIYRPTVIPLLHSYTKNRIWKGLKVCSKRMTSRVTQEHWYWRHSIDHIIDLVVFNYNYTMSLSCTFSETLPLLQRTWLPVTLRSPSASTFNIIETRASWFLCKHLLLHIHYIFWDTGVKKVSTSKVAIHRIHRRCWHE